MEFARWMNGAIGRSPETVRLVRRRATSAVHGRCSGTVCLAVPFGRWVKARLLAPPYGRRPQYQGKLPESLRLNSLSFITRQPPGVAFPLLGTSTHLLVP